MIRVLLINQEKIPHYRVPIYGYLAKYLRRHGFDLMVASEGVESGSTNPVEYQHEDMSLSFHSLVRFICKESIDVIIFWVNLKNLYLLPTCFMVKVILRRKIIYWGHGRDLLDKNARIKNMAYAIQQALCDAIILYAEHLKQYILKGFHTKTFVANNTLYIDYSGLPSYATRTDILSEYGIQTKKNIICMGRMQKRKRLDILVEALEYMNRPDIGLILVGPDPEGVLSKIHGKNIFKLGPIYGNKRFDLLSSADVYCLPGAVGLSIVDAFYCGLPIVTEEGELSPEIMYLKNGINGFVVPRNNIAELAQKLLLLLDNDVIRKQFSQAARREIIENGNIDKLCAGFRDALFYVTEKAA